MKTIVVSAVNIRKGGTLTILRSCLAYLSSLSPSEYRVIALVHNRTLVAYPHIQYLEFPNTIKGWGKRLWCEYITMHKVSKQLQPIDLWLSLHDTTPWVEARVQAVYCQTSFPFLKWRMRDLRFDYKIVLFALLTRFAYRINVHRNRFLIVQAQWLRNGFTKMLGLDRGKFVVFPPRTDRWVFSDRYLHAKHHGYTFFFAATPDAHKNFDVVCKAAEQLERKVGTKRFKVVLTISGKENNYSSYLHDTYHHVASIDFVGFLPKDKLNSLYKQADCMIFPSRIETWGLPISEFANYRKPMLLADLPYAHESAEGCEKVAFFQVNDVADLMGKMAMLLEGNENFLSEVPVNPIAEPSVSSWQELFQMLLQPSE